MTVLLAREIEYLKRSLLSLGTVVEESLHQAVKAVLEEDKRLAASVIKQDEEIDAREVEVEEDCLKILALHQPVAIDLRFIVAAMKINSDLERIGDLAANIAGRAYALSKLEKIPPPYDLEGMAAKTQELVHMSLQALVTMDCGLARDVMIGDEEVDHIHREMYVKTRHKIQESPQHTERLILLLSVSKNLERIADSATNIAEDTIYMIEGEIIRHGRDALLT